MDNTQIKQFIKLFEDELSTLHSKDDPSLEDLMRGLTLRNELLYLYRTMHSFNSGHKYDLYNSSQYAANNLPGWSGWRSILKDKS